MLPRVVADPARGTPEILSQDGARERQQIEDNADRRRARYGLASAKFTMSRRLGVWHWFSKSLLSRVLQQAPCRVLSLNRLSGLGRIWRPFYNPSLFCCSSQQALQRAMRLRRAQRFVATKHAYPYTSFPTRVRLTKRSGGADLKRTKRAVINVEFVGPRWSHTCRPATWVPDVTALSVSELLVVIDYHPPHSRPSKAQIKPKRLHVSTQDVRADTQH